MILSDYQPNAGSTYELWAAANFTAGELADALICGLAADPDGDGRANLMEYAQGTPPKAAGLAPAPSLSTAGGAVQFDFERDTFPHRPRLSL